MTDRELENLGMVCTLTSLGFTGEEIRAYLEAGEDAEGRERQIRMLKCRRGKLLDNIHSEQKLLDQIDFIIREKKKEADRIF